MTQIARRGRKIWVRIFLDKPVIARPAEKCMGSGKRSPKYWVAAVKPGWVLYEMGGVTENISRRAISVASSFHSFIGEQYKRRDARRNGGVLHHR